MSYTDFHATSWTCVKSGLKIEVTKISKDNLSVFYVYGPKGGFIDRNGELSYFAPSADNEEWQEEHRFNDFSAALIAAEKFVSNNLQYIYGGEE